MFPFRDHNPSLRTPFVTWSLIAVNIVIFTSYWPLFSDERALWFYFLEWGLVPAAARPETFVTSMFLHGGVMHLAGNMLFLWVFGDNLEDALGHFRFALFYLASGLAAAGAQFAADPGSMVPMVGASGAIAGVMGGHLLLYPRARVDVLIFIVIIIRVIPVPAWLVLSGWFGIQLLQGSVVSSAGGGVAYWAHAGGFVAGLVLIFPVWLRRGATRFWDQTNGLPPHPEAKYQYVRSGIPRVRR
ncbi:MAG: rhomboid family intramembrane serine protease [Boseongicola sp.]|nr:MAG: rhomboid family intramembrane serine protease [Boseongicola sp.]